MRIPSVGRMVHYQSYGTPKGEYTAQPRAAIITATYPYTDDDAEKAIVDLCVLNPTGMFFNQRVPFAFGDEPIPGHWNWPPRVYR